MGEMSYDQGMEKSSFELLAEFDSQLSRLEYGLDSLEGSLNPVLESLGPEATMASPEEAPIHDLHNSILRLRRLNNRLDTLRGRIRL